LPTVYKSYEQARYSAVAPSCGGPALDTYGGYLGVQWVKIGNTYYNAATRTAIAVTDYIFAVFVISKDQTVPGSLFNFKAGDKIALAITSGTTGSVGCSYPQSNITSVTYNNTVSCT